LGYQKSKAWQDRKAGSIYPAWGKVGKNRAASRENTPFARSASPYARIAAVRYTRVSFFASGTSNT
jgi:hypothetical protein